MRQIRRRRERAGIAPTILLDRLEKFAELRVVEILLPCLGEHLTMAPHAGRDDAVKGVDPLLHSEKDVFGLADAKKVARLVLGEDRIDPAHRSGDVFFGE